MFLCISKTYAHMYYYCGMEYTNKEPKTITIICAIALLTVSAAAIIKGSALLFFGAAFLGAYLLTPVKSK